MNFKNSRFRRRLFVLVPTLWLGLFWSCGKWGWEPVTGDTTPQLNVFGLISTDSTLQSFVVVHKTLGLSSPDQTITYDTLWYSYDHQHNGYYVWPHIASSYLVDDAAVTISDGTQSWNFILQADTTYGFMNRFSSDQSIYVDPAGTFTGVPDTDYELEITTPDSLHLTGQTHTPPKPVLYSDILPDTLVLHSNFTISWQFQADAINQIATYSDDYFCGSDYNELVRSGDSTWTTAYPFDCYRNEGGPSTSQLHIILKNLDPNYYGYFYENQANDFYSFLIGAGGTAIQYGVTGGLGVFGSFSRTGLARIAVP